MLSFRTDETNFGQGDREGIRIVPGAGLEVDFKEFTGDSDTLGLWHLHNGGCQGEGTGLEDASGNGRHLLNYGAAVVEDGYRFVHGEMDYMTTAIGAFSGTQSRVTLECWVRQWQSPLDTWSLIAAYHNSGWTNRVAIYALRSSVPANSWIRAWLQVGGSWIGPALWQGPAADAVLAGVSPWHAAAVLDAPTSLRLFVNGTLRATYASGIQGLQTGSYNLMLGTNTLSECPSAILDEVRLSGAARYEADFTPQRLLASGIYSSPTFDAMRIQADWLDLVRTQTVPSGTQSAWELRAADETDAFGDPQAVWEPYGGEPSALPDGRYFQWRATLSASADRLTTPTVRSVETVASEAGYNLYQAAGLGPESLDYAEPWARVGPTVTEVETAALQAGAVHWFGIRPVNAEGIESAVAQGEVRLELGAQGERAPDRPAGTLALCAGPLPLGKVRLDWRYRVGSLGVVPQTFRIFGDRGTGTIDYGTPLGEVAYQEGHGWYTWTSGQMDDGVEYQLAIRAITAAGVWDEQPAVVHATPDAAAPGEVDVLEAEAIL